MKTIELSLSPKYVSGWGVEEAVREILQNAIDQKADGAEVSVSYDRETLSILTDARAPEDIDAPARRIGQGRRALHRAVRLRMLGA